MINSNITAQYIGQGQVLLKLNENANSKRGCDSAQISASTVASFKNDIAAVSYANLVNSTGILYGPKLNDELVKDVFQLSENK